MIDKQYLSITIEKLKKAIAEEIKNNNLEIALELVFNCANILYQTNQYYVDEELENAIKNIVKGIRLNQVTNLDRETLLYYDGFGLNDRGLAQIYLKALCQLRKVIYVTYDDCKDRIPDILDILKKSNSKALFINRKRENFISEIKELNDIIIAERPKDFFFYSIPNDVVGTVIMNTYEGILNRFQINLTDHAFWLGARCIDKCIEFRDYGAIVSNKYRNISKEKIVELPFYPMLHTKREFQGYPFEVKNNQKVIFSGGALYKTIGGDNKYYIIVDNILSKHNDVIFWYAGSGDDSEIKKILSKYPRRAYLTSERSDLYQVIKHSRFYLSTYPMCGGLMYQFAACAGKVPITLHYDECTDGFLLKQNQLNIEFDTVEELCKEVDKLLDDDSYYEAREKEMLGAVISEEKFTSVLSSIINDDTKNVIGIEYTDLNTESFRSEYLERIGNIDIDGILANRDTIKASIKHTTVKFLRGEGTKITKKILMKFR